MIRINTFKFQVTSYNLLMVAVDAESLTDETQRFNVTHKVVCPPCTFVGSRRCERRLVFQHACATRYSRLVRRTSAEMRHHDSIVFHLKPPILTSQTHPQVELDFQLMRFPPLTAGDRQRMTSSYTSFQNSMAETSRLEMHVDQHAKDHVFER